MLVERFYSRDQQPYWITETEESICLKIEFNSRIKGVVSKETVVLRRWGSSIQNFVLSTELIM